MSRGMRVAVIGCAAMLIGLMATSVTAQASTPISLLLPQGSAFAVLGHSCGGIQEKSFSTGFDPTSGYPLGDVYLSTTCSAGGRGGHSSTFTAWSGVTWDFTGATVAFATLSVAPTVNPTFSAFDANGNEVYNQSSAAYLVWAPTFTPAPRITGLSVTQGPASGGTSVTITGTGFTGATSVTFGGVAAASFSIAGDTSITAVTPSTVGGTVDVAVTTGGGASASTAGDLFTFVATPSVSGLSPAKGPVSGGTQVIITGVNFTYASAVTFGETGAGFTVNSDTSITAVAPFGEQPDTVAVHVTSLGGTSATSPGDVYTYAATQAVAVTPTSGPPATPVTVSGTVFTPGETVKVSYKTGLAAPKPASVAVCSTTAADDGSFSCGGAIPPATTAGALKSHKIVATGTSSKATVSTAFLLT